MTAGDVVVIACARCRAEVHTVTDGPGLHIVQLEGPEEATEPGDDCAPCPECGLKICVRILRRAA